MDANVAFDPREDAYSKPLDQIDVSVPELYQNASNSALNGCGARDPVHSARTATGPYWSPAARRHFAIAVNNQVFSSRGTPAGSGRGPVRAERPSPDGCSGITASVRAAVSPGKSWQPRAHGGLIRERNMRGRLLSAGEMPNREGGLDRADPRMLATLFDYARGSPPADTGPTSPFHYRCRLPDAPNFGGCRYAELQDGVGDTRCLSRAASNAQRST
jgi:hypothetical protein